MIRQLLVWVAVVSAAWSLPALALNAPSNGLDLAIKRELSKNYLGARIELLSAIEMGSDPVPAGFNQVQIQNETARGEAYFAVSAPNSTRPAIGRVLFAAWVPARIALRRVLPGQRLLEEQFKRQEVNIASGMAREYRGVILEPEAELSYLESRQTILEGQFILSTAVQKIPDLRRGDSVRVNLTAGGLSLSTQGIAGEPAYLNGQVRVIAGKNKRELVGKLVSGGLVEVKL